MRARSTKYGESTCLVSRGIKPCRRTSLHVGNEFKLHQPIRDKIGHRNLGSASFCGFLLTFASIYYRLRDSCYLSGNIVGK